MPRYFEARSSNAEFATLAHADFVATTMNDAASALGVRILAIKRLSARRFVYAYSSRRAQTENAVVHALRTDPRLAEFEFSGEREVVEASPVNQSPEV